VIDDQWLSDYLLGEAGAEERRELERRMEADPELRARVRGLDDVTRRLLAVPPAAWDAIADPRPADSVPAPRTRRSSRFGGRSMPQLVGAALAAVLLFAAGFAVRSLSNGTAGSRPARELALDPLAGGPTNVSGVVYFHGELSMVLVIRYLPATAPGGYYEAWLMTSLTKLVPLTSFRVNSHGQARLTLQLPASESDYRYIDVSRQSVGAGTAHSADSVLRGPT
jgi:hypothetical protein